MSNLSYNSQKYYDKRNYPNLNINFNQNYNQAIKANHLFTKKIKK